MEPSCSTPCVRAAWTSTAPARPETSRLFATGCASACGRHGRAIDPMPLIEGACGERLDASHYTRYLTEKFSAIYDL